MAEPPLRFLHSADSLSPVKVDRFRKQTTAALVDSLRPGQAGALKTRAGGTVLEGHHRLVVLRERGIDIDALPRQIVPRDIES